MVIQIQIKNKFLLTSLVAATAIAQVTVAPELAFAASGTDVSAAIEKSHVLLPGAKVTAKVENSSVTLSTYSHEKANAKDLKIDAILMSKAVFDLDSSVSRVNVYFYSKDLSQYKKTSVSAGDVKAFASGATGKEDILKSLPLEVKEANETLISSINGIDDLLFEQTSSKDGIARINTELDPDMTDLDLKYAAMRAAVQALKNSSDAKEIKVVFAGGDSHKSVVFDAEKLRNLESSLTTILNGVSFDNLSASEGPMREERQKLADRITALRKNKVGVKPFIAAFNDIEKQAGTSGADLTSSIAHLSDSIGTQEKALQEAKLKASQAASTKANPVAASGPMPRYRMPAKRVTRWAMGIEPLNERSIMNDCAGYLQEVETKLAAANGVTQVHNEDDVRYAHALEFFVQTLSADPAKRSDLIMVGRKLEAIQRRHPDFI